MKKITLLVIVLISYHYIQAQNQRNLSISNSLNDLQEVAMRANQSSQNAGSILETNAHLIIKYSHGDLSSPQTTKNGEEEWRLHLDYNNGLLVSATREPSDTKQLMERSTFEYNKLKQLSTIRLFYLKGMYPYEVGRTEFSYDTDGRRVKMVQFVDKAMIAGDSVQIVKKDNRVVSYSEFSGGDQWVKTMEISNIAYNKKNNLISFTHKSWEKTGRLILQQDLRNVQFLDPVLNENSPLFRNADLNNPQNDLSIFDNVFNPDFKGQFLSQPIQFEKQVYSVNSGEKLNYEVKKAWFSENNNNKELTMLTYGLKQRPPSEWNDEEVITEVPNLIERVTMDAQGRLVRYNQMSVEHLINRDFRVNYNEWNLPENTTMIVSDLEGLKEITQAQHNRFNVEDKQLRELTIKKLTRINTEENLSVSHFEFFYKSKPDIPDYKLSSGVSVYPNPTSSWVTIHFPLTNVLTSPKIFVTNLSGTAIAPAEVRLSNNAVSINLSNFSPGVYLVTFELDGKKVSEKVIRAQ